MPTYRKKPIDVEMFQWTGDLDALYSWSDGLVEANKTARGLTGEIGADRALRLWVAKGQTTATVEWGDWVALEGDGDGYYPIANAVRAVTYDPMFDNPHVERAVDFGGDERAFALLAQLMQADSGIGIDDADWLCEWIRHQTV